MKETVISKKKMTAFLVKMKFFPKKNISFKYISFVATLSSNPQFFKWITISALSFYTRR